MEFRMARGEVFLRISAILLLVLTACLVAFDTQTKLIIYTVEKKATYRDIEALRILVYMTCAAGGYNLLHLCKDSVSARSGRKASYLCMAWVCLLLDQIAVYATFAANSAALGGSLLAITGAEAFQWMKVCNKFTRFCFQIGGALICCYVACILMAMLSSVSAYKLFRLYSPKQFLRLKSK